jgi:hypothetical protein
MGWCGMAANRAVLRGMVRSEQDGRAGHFDSVPEGGPGARHRMTAIAPDPKRVVEGEAAERHDDGDARELVDLALEPGAAVGALEGSRPVARRRAADGGCDEAVAELEPVAPVHALGLVGEARPPERAVEPAAGLVAGERATRPVAAVRGRREADDQEPRLRVSPARHRPAPVLLVGERPPLLARHLLAPGHEPRAAHATDDVALEGAQLRRQCGLHGQGLVHGAQGRPCG